MIRKLGQRPFTSDLKTLRVALGKVGLAQPSGWLSFAVHQAVPYSVSTSGTKIFGATIPRDMILKSWHQQVYIHGTNNGSNYWTFTLSPVAGGSIATLDTSAISGVTNAVLSTALNNAVTTGTDTGLLITVTKTGSPGNLYAQCPAVFAI